MIKDENKETTKARTNIQINARGLNEKLLETERVEERTLLKTIETNKSSKLDMIKDEKVKIIECEYKNFLALFLLAPKHLAKAISLAFSTICKQLQIERSKTLITVDSIEKIKRTI